MTAFKNTIVGKILRGAAKVAAGAAGVVLGGTVVKAAVGGIGSLVNSNPTTSPKTSGISIIAEKAKALVSGLTYEQQKILDEEKQNAKTATQKLKLANKLMSLGVDEDTAYKKAGISKAELVSVADPTDGEEKKSYAGQETNTASLGFNKKYLLYAAAGLAALVLLPKLLKR